MIKRWRYILAVAAITVGFGAINMAVSASLEQLRIANVLLNEANQGGEKSMTKVAEVMRNIYNTQRNHYKVKDITYSDILFFKNTFEGARDKFSHLNKEQLEKKGKDFGKGNWDIALRLADSLLQGTLTSNLVGNSNAFMACSSRFTTVAAAQACFTNKKIHVQYLDVISHSPTNHAFWNWELGAYKHAYQSDVVAASDPNYAYSSSSGASASEDEDGSKDTGSCSLDVMRDMYLGAGENEVEKQCWYCTIVVVLVNAFLQAANEAMSTTTALAKVILKGGFLIWLAYYILQQVSSMKAVAIGKMVQEIVVMGFKVALAWAAIDMGIQFIRDYYVNPLVGMGVDYGTALFNGMNNLHETGG